MISFQKIYDLHGLEHHTVEINGDVTLEHGHTYMHVNIVLEFCEVLAEFAISLLCIMMIFCDNNRMNLCIMLVGAISLVTAAVEIFFYSRNRGRILNSKRLELIRKGSGKGVMK